VKPHHFTARFRQPKRMLSKNTARMWDKAKPLVAYRRRLCCLRLPLVGQGSSALPMVDARGSERVALRQEQRLAVRVICLRASSPRQPLTLTGSQ
jgi:hypothetical protein